MKKVSYLRAYKYNAKKLLTIYGTGFAYKLTVKRPKVFTQLRDLFN